MSHDVPAIERLDKILDYLYRNEKATHLELIRDLGIPKTTVMRTLFTGTQLGYIAQFGKTYSIGNRIRYFATKNVKSSIIHLVSYPLLEELSLRFKKTFKISILDRDKIRVVASVQSGDFYQINVSENSIFPVYAGAASKLLICQLDKAKLNLILPKKLEKFTKNTIVDRELLEKELFDINIKKVAYDKAEHCEFIGAVAFPIYSKGNRIIASLSCPYLYKQRKTVLTPELLSEMKKTADLITENLKGHL